MSTYISLGEAQKAVADINNIQPPINPSESARVAYADTPASTNTQSDQDRDYYAVWKVTGFSQNCKNVLDSQVGYPGSWTQFIRNEYDAWMKNHEPASQYGLPEGLTWVFVE